MPVPPHTCGKHFFGHVGVNNGHDHVGNPWLRAQLHHTVSMLSL